MSTIDDSATNNASLLVLETETIYKAMEVLNANSRGIVYVKNEQGAIVASLTDGDIRRYILQNHPLDEPVSQAANYRFTRIREEEISTAGEHMKKSGIRSIPVLDEQGRLVTVLFNEKLPALPKKRISAPVVIMAGGAGTRLRPYTQILPKPLIPIGDVTITEHIMNRFAEYGCERFSLVVNYKKNMIKTYFMDEALDYKIRFIEEDKPLGTGGGIKLLQEDISQTFFVTNCDIIVLEDYAKIYEYHKEQGNMVTLVCATKVVTIPYGTVIIDDSGDVTELREKPCFSFIANTGMYVVEPGFFEQIPGDTFIHITEILERCLEKGIKIGIYPISESQWLDMGQMDELGKMCQRLTTED